MYFKVIGDYIEISQPNGKLVQRFDKFEYAQFKKNDCKIEEF